MRILITSDTHGYYGKISDFILSRDDIDLMIHAGDGVKDCISINYETGVSYYVVKGNNDFYCNEPYYKIIEIEGHRIYLTHGHKENVDFSLENLLEKAKNNSCDIAIFGHIHRYIELESLGILVLNPGSASLPRDGVASAIIMDIDSKGIRTKKVLLD